MEAAFQLHPRPKLLDRRLTRAELARRLQRIETVLPELNHRLNPCQLCLRRCGAERLRGEVGECGLDGQLRVASVARHSGEEPLISGSSGVINVFFSGCNLHCLHCQNWPISQQRVGQTMPPEELAEKILKKWRRGAHTLGWVTPTPQIPQAVEAYRICLQQGFDLPLVHNGGGYDDPEILELLSGVVDIWLPDAKTADPQQGRSINGAPFYPERNQQAIVAMVQQVASGAARAVIVRHLLLPGKLRDSREVLARLWASFGNRIHISLMAQYFPTYRTLGHPELGREVTQEDYDKIVEFAQDLGFRRGWIQQSATEIGIPLNCLM